MRRHILRTLSESGESHSPTWLADTLHLPLSTAAYHVTILRKFGAVEPAGEKGARRRRALLRTIRKMTRRSKRYSRKHAGRRRGRTSNRDPERSSSLLGRAVRPGIGSPPILETDTFTEGRHEAGDLAAVAGDWRRGHRAVRRARRQRLRGEGEDQRQGDQGEVDARQPAEAALGRRPTALEARRPAEPAASQAAAGAADRRRDRRADPRPGAERGPRRHRPTRRRARSTPRPRSTPSTRSTRRRSTATAPAACRARGRSPAPAGRARRAAPSTRPPRRACAARGGDAAGGAAAGGVRRRAGRQPRPGRRVVERHHERSQVRMSTRGQ